MHLHLSDLSRTTADDARAPDDRGARSADTPASRDT
jgi:hypothetical protein